MDKWLSRSLLTVPLLELTLPRYVKCSTAFKVGAIDAGVRTACLSWNTLVFFRLIVRPKFLAASEERLTMCCRASSVWAGKAQTSANSSSVMNS